MRMAAVIEQRLKATLSFLHRRTVMSLVYGVNCLLSGGLLTLTGLGRAGADHRGAKHQIKRIDRLLGNDEIQDRISEILGAVATELIGRRKEIIVLVDWTELPSSKYALTASLPVGGRSVLIHWRVCKATRVGSRPIQRQFLQDLTALIPQSCKVTIVTDAGFQAPWFREVRALGWHFVGRIRGSVQCCEGQRQPWYPAKKLYDQAGLIPRDLGSKTLSKSNSVDVRFVLVRGRRKPGPKKARLTTKQKPGGAKRSASQALTLTAQKNKHRTAAQEPWLLATSRPSGASRIVKIYQKRMQTEATYRDVKDARFGWSMSHARSRSNKRLEVLLLTAMLASLVLLAVAHAAERKNLHRRFQANTVRAHRVLSLTRLGAAIIFEPSLWEKGFDLYVSMRQLLARGLQCSSEEK